MDYLSKFSDEQAITTTAVSTNVVDLELVNPNLGEGTPLFARVRVTADFADGTSLKVSLQDSADNSTFADLASTAAIATATLVQGYNFVKLAIPDEHRRYVRLNYTVSGTMTAGKVTAWVGLG